MLALLSAVATAAPATPGVVVFAVPTTSAMPTASFRDNDIEAGILKDLGLAIAARMQRTAQFVSLPRKRLDHALQTGRVDGVCNFAPQWLDVQLNWSQPMIADENLLLISPQAPRPATLGDVAGKTLGLVLGFKYPELEAALGQSFVREDAPNTPINIKKLLAGRLQYMVVDKLSLDYYARANPQLKAYATLPIAAFNLRCGFSMASDIPFADVDKAIRLLVKSGELDRLLAVYRN